MRKRYHSSHQVLKDARIADITQAIRNYFAVYPWYCNPHSKSHKGGTPWQQIKKKPEMLLQM